MKYSADIKKPKRYFLPEDFKITDWETIEPYFKELLEREISSKENLEHWLGLSELEAVISEDACWRQIRMTCDTEIKSLKNHLIFFAWRFNQKFNPMQTA